MRYRGSRRRIGRSDSCRQSARARDAHAVAHAEPAGPVAERLHPADHLVSGDDAVAAGREVALGEVEVRSAYPATRDADEELPWARVRLLPLDQRQGPHVDGARCVDDPRLHGHSLRRQPSFPTITRQG